MKYRVVVKKIGAKSAEYIDVEAKNLNVAKRLAGKILVQKYCSVKEKEDMIVWVWEGHTRYEREIYIPFGRSEPKVTRWSGPCQIITL